MDITIARNVLIDAAEWMSTSLPKKSITPVLLGARLTASLNDDLALSSFDYESASTSVAEARVAEPGVIVVPGRMFSQVVGVVAKTVEDVSLRSDDRHLTITAGRFKASLPLMAAHDYPALPPVPPAAGTVVGTELQDCLRRILPTISRGDVMGQLEGVKMEEVTDGLALRATDRYRIASATVPWERSPLRDEFDTGLDALLPRRAVAAAIKMLDSYDATIGWDENLLSLTSGTKTHVFRLMSTEEYPQSPVFPSPTITVQVETQELIDAIKRISVGVEDEMKDTIGLEFTNTSLAVGTLNEAGELDAREELDVSADLPDEEKFFIKFRSGYLLDMLSALGKQAVLGLLAAHKPMTAYSTGEGTWPDYHHLVMPRRIK